MGPTLSIIKSMLVAAHRNEDWELAKKLSQEKETMKRKSKVFCPDCGVVIHNRSFHCQMHARLYRFGKRLVFALALISFVSIAASPVPIQVFWNPQPGVDLFILHGTNDISQPTPWPIITTFAGNSTNASLSVFPGAMNYYLTASNFWGETGLSNIASTPSALTNVSG